VQQAPGNALAGAVQPRFVRVNYLLFSNYK